jgi:imidazolonepropionase
MKLAIRNIGQLVTMQGGIRTGKKMSYIGLVTDGIVHIDGDKISYAGPISSAPQFASQQEIDAKGCVVTPGLVDAHTHAVFAGNRADEFEQLALGTTYQEITAQGRGILTTVAKTRAASEGELFEESKQHAEWMIRCGTTTAEVKSGYGLDLETELKMLRVAKDLQSTGLSVVRTFLGPHCVPKQASSKAEYLDHVINDMLPAVAKECEFVDMFVEDKYFSHDDARRLAARAIEFNLGLRLHVDQMRDSGGAKLAAELGSVSADHLEFTGSDGIDALAKYKTFPILLPGSVYGMRSDNYPDARQMIEKGLPVVLATDFNPGTSPTPSLPFCMSLAVTKMRMSVGECLAACTINAAYSLNRGDIIGSLEPGKVADLVIWDFNDYRELAYWAGHTPIRQVIKFGQALSLS